jgi:hypothetical protein
VLEVECAQHTNIKRDIQKTENIHKAWLILAYIYYVCRNGATLTNELKSLKSVKVVNVLNLELKGHVYEYKYRPKWGGRARRLLYRDHFLLYCAFLIFLFRH